jgi:hypothetical protein
MHNWNRVYPARQQEWKPVSHSYLGGALIYLVWFILVVYALTIF